MAITKEQAIEILSTRDFCGMLCGYTSGVTEALNMAIEALLFCNKLVCCWECKYKDECPQTILLDANNKIINFCSYGEREGGDSE